MAQGLIKKETLSSIADAIREKAGGEETYLPSQMPDAIRNLKIGGYTFEMTNQDGIWVPNAIAGTGSLETVNGISQYNFYTPNIVLDENSPYIFYFNGTVDGTTWQQVIYTANVLGPQTYTCSHPQDTVTDISLFCSYFSNKAEIFMVDPQDSDEDRTSFLVMGQGKFSEQAIIYHYPDPAGNKILLKITFRMVAGQRPNPDFTSISSQGYLWLPKEVKGG